jgi:hypothetical protein
VGLLSLIIIRFENMLPSFEAARFSADSGIVADTALELLLALVIAAADVD